MPTDLRPVRLPMNRPTPRPYRGGAAIEAFRGQRPTGDDRAPEDFLASTVTTFGKAQEGLTVIGGTYLRDLVEEHPVAYLGEEHVARYGADPRLLCKLLHTGERLFVHAHPDGEFARRRLGMPNGKTEAWIILAVDENVGSSAWVGFTDDVGEDQLTAWFDTQDSAAMLDGLNEVPLHPGDTLLVPAGVPHAIGAGVLLLELQEPADLSMILEYAPFEALTREDGLLGLDEATALTCVDRRAFGPDRLSEAVGITPADAPAWLFSDAAAPFFRAQSVVVRGGAEVSVPAAFTVLVVTDGVGTLGWAGSAGTPGGADERMPIMAGDVLLVPHGVGETRIAGDLRAVRCLPPAATA